jgi:hypothetical protein
MPVSRRIAKARRVNVTAEAVEAFQIASKHQETYFACAGLRAPCKSAGPARHCDECRTYLLESTRLDRLLGVRPWEASPLHVAPGDDATIRPGDLWAESIPYALQLRSEFEKLAKR